MSNPIVEIKKTKEKDGVITIEGTVTLDGVDVIDFADELKTDGSHTAAQVERFIKRKAKIYYLQGEGAEGIETMINQWPTPIELTQDDLADENPWSLEVPV